MGDPPAWWIDKVLKNQHITKRYTGSVSWTDYLVIPKQGTAKWYYFI